jgi:poly-beta-hydroxyalkanoate depolymerase
MDTPDGTSIDANQNTTGVGLMNVSAENVDLRMAGGQQAASNVSVATNNSQTRGGDTVIMNPPKPNKTREANATR